LTQAKLKAEKSSLTFLHGIGLKLESVSLEHPEANIEAKHLNINVRLLPLLLGKIEVSTLDVHDAHFSIRSGLLDQTNLSSLAALPVQRIRLIRARFDDYDGNRLLEDVRLDLRNLGPEHEALWEFQAEQSGHPMNGHGTLDFHHGEIRGGFGKLKFDTIPLTWLAPLAPVSMQQWFDNPDDRLSGALTLDLKEDNAWSIFGEVTAKIAAKERSVSLRGKLHHPAKEQYFWDDSFIHLSDNAVITTKGQCSYGECNSSVAANGIPLQAWGGVLPETISLLQSLTGTTDMKASLQWKGEQWQARGDLLLKNGQYQQAETEVELPELYFDQASIVGDQDQWQAEAVLSVAQTYGKIAIQSSSQAAGDMAFGLQSDGFEKFPQALVDTLLAALDIGPGLQANGKLAGSMQFQRKADGENSLQFSVVADQAQIALPTGFEKPAGVAAQCGVTVRWPENSPFQPTSVQLEQCRLDSSGVGLLSWDGQEKRFQADQLAIDLTALQQHAVRLPEWFRGTEGQLTGKLAADWPGSDWLAWLGSADGALSLSEFGTGNWRASGELRLERGRLASKQFSLRGSYGKADLQGEYSLDDRQGSVDLIDGELDWSSLPPLPESWTEVKLAGEIRQGRLKLLDNELQGISGHYRLQKGTLGLEKLSAELAGGVLYSPLFSLTPNESGLSVEGHIRGEELQLSALGGISAWVQAELDGKLHLNLDLHGRLPATDIANWHYSNGDILIYNGSWRPNTSKTLPERLGIETALKPARFSMLSFRFRLQGELVDISKLELRHGERRFTGVADIGRDGESHGAVKASSGDIFALEGDWPLPNWQAAE